MPTVLIQTRMSEPAAPLIDALVQVRRLRHHLKISRRAFLARWGQLRRRLAATAEYQAFREAVIARDGAKCAICRRASRTVHHKTPVSHAPRLALFIDNGSVRCGDCHAKVHPWLKEVAA